jgi:hypothetical protein
MVALLALGISLWRLHEDELRLRADSPRAERYMSYCGFVHEELRAIAMELSRPDAAFHDVAPMQFGDLSRGAGLSSVELCVPELSGPVLLSCLKTDETCMRVEVAKAMMLTALH